MVCKQPKYREKQQALMCGKHAINNLVQKKKATCKQLNKIGKNISNNFGIPVQELVDETNGLYDISVLETWLIENGYETHTLAPTNFHKMSLRQSSRLMGYIIGDGNHWAVLRKTETVGCYFLIDSLSHSPFLNNTIIETPKLIKNIKKWLAENQTINLVIKVLEKKKI